MNLTDLALMVLVGAPVVALVSFVIIISMAECKYAKSKKEGL